MIAKLIPSQIADSWEIIKFAIENSLPPIAKFQEEMMNRILTSCLCGQSDVWIIFDRIEDKNYFKGIAVTRELVDDVSMTKSLLLYSLYGFEELNSKIYIEGLKSLFDYAKSKGCLQIVAYTDFPQVVELAKRLGGESRYFVSFKIV